MDTASRGKSSPQGRAHKSICVFALALAAPRVRIEAPIPNKAAVGIEVPNRVSNTVCLRELLDSSEFRSAKSKLTVALGHDITGKIVLADEISPDSCRLWDSKTGEKLDKDRFRRDLGGVEEAYNEVMRRLMGE